MGAFAPAGTLPALVQWLNAEIIRVATSAPFREKFVPAVGLEWDLSAANSPKVFVALVRSGRDAWGRLAKIAGAQPQ